MMDWQRTGLIAGILVVLYLLLLEWTQFQETQPVPPQAQTAEQVIPTGDIPPSIPETSSGNTEASGDLPTVLVEPGSDSEDTASLQTSSGQLVRVTTDVLDVVIDTRGGDIVEAGLLKHRESLDEGAPPFGMLVRSANRTYVAQSGLVGPNGTDTQASRPVFQSARQHYSVSGEGSTLNVDLTLNQDGVQITKRFHFSADEYLIGMEYLIDNQSEETWKAALYGQIKRDGQPAAKKSGGGLGIQPYLGAAITTVDKNFKKLDFDEIEEEPFKTTREGGWVAMVQHYFISAWIPGAEQTNAYSVRKSANNDIYLLGFTSPLTTVASGEKTTLSASFYVGPKDQYRLEKISPYLDLTVDYGWLWWIAKPLFWFMLQLHNLVGNWGWSIILLTIAIKLVFFKLSATSYRSMAKMRKLQPEMTRLRDLYGDDRQKLSQETMNLYKREKVNPMGGCLPILVQMPVFISLYWVLLESVELRHAPWILWIQDMSVRDPFFILPLLMGASMFVQMRLNPAPPDPMQAKVMQIMPVAFTFFFLFFPAGLVLYWTVNNILSIAQQWVITRAIENGESGGKS